MYREGDVERALSFVSLPAKEAAGQAADTSMSQQIPACFAPLLYHHGYSVAATAQVSGESSVIFVGAPQHAQYTCSASDGFGHIR